jgi:hypothetical protein
LSSAPSQGMSRFGQAKLACHCSGLLFFFSGEWVTATSADEPVPNTDSNASGDGASKPGDASNGDGPSKLDDASNGDGPSKLDDANNDSDANGDGSASRRVQRRCGSFSRKAEGPRARPGSTALTQARTPQLRAPKEASAWGFFLCYNVLPNQLPARPLRRELLL